MAIGSPWVGTVAQGNVAGTSVSTIAVDVSGATNGEVVWIIGTLGDAEVGAITAPAGWNTLGQTSEGTSGGSSSRTVIFWKVKQASDGTITITDATNWTVATKPQFVPISWPGVDPTNPAEGLSWLAHTTGTSYVTGTATPTDANRWAVGVFSARGTTATVAWTPDAALTERVDAVNSASTFVGLEVADSNGAVTAAAHTYTAVSQTASHGLGGLFFLIPAADIGSRSRNQHPGSAPGLGARFRRKRPVVASQPGLPTGVKGYHSAAASTSVGSIDTIITTRAVAGDIGVAVHVYNPTTQETPDPAGWTLIDTQPISATAHARIYKKILTLAEAGSNVTFTNSTLQRLSAGNIVLDGTVYSDVDVFAGAIEGTVRQNHTSPLTANRTLPGIELNFYAMRSSTPSWFITPPSSSALATQAFGVGSGATGVAIAVNPAYTPAGVPAGGLDWNENVATGTTAMWTLAFAAVTAGGGTTQTGDASLTATASITATADVVRAADSTLTATAAISPAASKISQADSSLTGTAAIAATAQNLPIAAAAVSAVAGITASASVTRSADVAVTVTAARTATAAKTANADATVSAVAAITGTAAATHIAGVSFTATATITAATVDVSAAAVVATASITATASVVRGADATLAATAAINPVASKISQANASLTATAAIAASSTAVRNADSTLTITATRTATVATSIDASLTATAAIVATASVVRAANASLTASAILSAIVARTAVADALLTGTAAIITSAGRIVPVTAQLTVTASITAVATAFPAFVPAGRPTASARATGDSSSARAGGSTGSARAVNDTASRQE
jgi:hypothetical protein